MSKHIDDFVGLYSIKTGGHRDQFNKFLLEKIPSSRLVRKWSHPGPLVFMMIEESFPLFFAISTFRLMIGLKTSGLLFRLKPLEADDLSFKLKIKKYLLKLLKKSSSVRVFSLFDPKHIGAGYDYIHDWIHDFQIWDLIGTDTVEDVKSQRSVKNFEDLPKIQTLVVLGVLNGDKGADDLIEVLKNRNSEGHDLVVKIYGNINHRYLDEIKFNLRDGDELFNGHVDDALFWKGYAEADLIWAFYSKNYDQSSGIVGRAIQFGVPVVVRRGAIIDKILSAMNVHHYPLDKAVDIFSINPRGEVFDFNIGLNELKLAGLNDIKKLSYKN